jgi:ribosomal protein S6
MNRYELTFLLNSEEEKKTVSSLLTSLDGKVVEEKHWGKLQFAYPINHKTSADYFTWVIDVDNKKVAELKKKLNFDEKLIRYLLLEVES